MAMSSRILASGSGWRVCDCVCSAGPEDRAYEERHKTMCIALVTGGTFEYRASQGYGLMAPGSLLLGNADTCFECRHTHGRGDRCLSFQFSRELFEPVVAATPGARALAFSTARLPLLPALLPLTSEAQSLRDEQGDGNGDSGQFEELMLRLAGAVCLALSDSSRSRRAPTARDERRVARALRRIEAHPGERLSLAELAADAAASPCHFLRVFEQVVGVTPGQYVLRARLQMAAIRLRSSDASVSEIAQECDFGDLSTFNRHFRRTMGVSPSAFRKSGSTLCDRSPAAWPRHLPR